MPCGLFSFESIGSHLTAQQTDAALTPWCFPLCVTRAFAVEKTQTTNWDAHGNFTLITRVYFENMPKTVKLIIAALRRARLVIYEAQCSCTPVNKHNCGDRVMCVAVKFPSDFSVCAEYVYARVIGLICTSLGRVSENCNTSLKMHLILCCISGFVFSILKLSY